MLLTYEAIDGTGKRCRDTIEATSAQAASTRLRGEGLFVTQIAHELPGTRVEGRASPPARRLPLKVLVQVTRQLAMLLRAGCGVVPALAAIQKQLKRPEQRALVSRMIADLEDGTTLTEALRRHPGVFGAVYRAIVAAGEASGSLGQMFDRLAVIVAKSRALRKKLLGALAYPALLIGMCFHILLVLLFFVLPRFDGMFKQLGVETPSVTKALLAVGSALQSYWPVFVLAAGALGAGGAWLATSTRGRQRISNWQLHIPGLGPLRSRLIQGQVFRTMGMLTESGVGVLETIELVRGATGNRRFQGLFDQMQASVSGGGRLSYALETSGLIDPSLCQAIHTGEDSGNLGEALTFCADVLDESNEETIVVLTRLIEPAILIGMGAVVGGVAIALFLPLFDLTSAIR
ncbi:MAG: type II secretion system F family protein [Planctomycetota bacterium]